MHTSLLYMLSVRHAWFQCGRLHQQGLIGTDSCRHGLAAGAVGQLLTFTTSRLVPSNFEYMQATSGLIYSTCVTAPQDNCAVT
jgi:hypothetical protein